MENQYIDYIEKYNTDFPTSIHTKINSRFRISSVFRKATTDRAMYYWETFVWDGDKIHVGASHNTIDGVMQYHYDKYFDLKELEK